MQRVLVTGASGFIGRRLVQSLAGEGVSVVALARNEIPGLPAGARTFRGDLTDATSIAGAATDCDTIIHLAGLSHRMGSGPVSEQAEYDRVNVGGATAILDEARRAGVQRLLFMSTTSAAGRERNDPLTETAPSTPTDAYGRSKLRAESMIREAGARGDLWTVAVRPPMVYGPGNKGNLPRLMRLVRGGIPLPLGAVRNKRSVLYIENLVHAVKLIVGRQPGNGDLFYVSDAHPLSTPDLIRRIGRAVGRAPILVPVPPVLLRAMGRVGDQVAKVAPLPLTSQEVMRLVGSLYIDHGKLTAATGYTAPFTTEQGITAMAASIYGSPGSPRAL